MSEEMWLAINETETQGLGKLTCWMKEMRHILQDLHARFDALDKFVTHVHHRVMKLEEKEKVNPK